ncbi:MAG: septum formation family protein [Acidimicrobiales bacterium]
METVRPLRPVIIAVAAVVALGGCTFGLGSEEAATTVATTATTPVTAPPTTPPTTQAPTTTLAPTTTVRAADTSTLIRPTEIEVGDCLRGFMVGQDVSSVARVACQRPHEQEAYHQFDLPDGEFPGAESINSSSSAECTDAFEEFVGVPNEASRYGIFTLTPTQGSWSAGDRTVICLLGLDQGITTGSAAGTGQ